MYLTNILLNLFLGKTDLAKIALDEFQSISEMLSRARVRAL